MGLSETEQFGTGTVAAVRVSVLLLEDLQDIIVVGELALPDLDIWQDLGAGLSFQAVANVEQAGLWARTAVVVGL